MAEKGELEFYFDRPQYFPEKLIWKEETKERTEELLSHTLDILKRIEENEFNSLSIKKRVWEYATTMGRGSVLWPLRYALSGMDRSPDPFTLAEILGKYETVDRVTQAIKKLHKEV
jgi:hypothetical protein